MTSIFNDQPFPRFPWLDTDYDNAITPEDMEDMSERQILYKLVGDVSGLKQSMENEQALRRELRESMRFVQGEIGTLSRKLDMATLQENRLQELETVARDYRTIKNRMIGLLLGVGLCGGSLGGLLGAGIVKALMGG